jgi:hypothetical protein
LVAARRLRYGYGLSFNTMADLLGTTAQSVLRWVCGSVDRCCSKPPSSDAVVIELDEMWHFLQRRDNKVWIWKAYDRATGRLVDWESGGYFKSHASSPDVVSPSQPRGTSLCGFDACWRET